jgi:cytochrome c556
MVLKLDNPSKDNVESIKNSIRNFTNATAKTSKFIDFNKGIVTESFTIFMNEDEAEYVMESAHGKVVRNTLWGWFIGHFGVRANNATKKGGKNRYHLHAPTFILFLFGCSFTSSIWNAIHANRLSKDEIDDIAVKSLIKDMAKISNTLFESSDGSVEILKMRKFRHAVDDLSDDLKYIIKKLDPKATKLRANLTKLKGSADACLDHVYKGSDDAGKYLQELLDNMDATAKLLCDVDKVIDANKDNQKFKEALEIQKLTADDFPEDDDDTNDKDGE